MRVDKKIVQLPKAGFWIRLFAWLLDHLFIALPTTLILSILFYKTPLSVIRDFSSLLTGIFFIPYAIFFWGRYGATPGKMICGLKIITVDGQKIGYERAALRYLGYIICNITLGIGYLLIIFSKNKQGLHDKVAQTYVVRTRAMPGLRPTFTNVVKVGIALVAAFIIGTLSSSIIFNILLGFPFPFASVGANFVGGLLAGLFVGWYLGQKGWLYGVISGVVLIVGHEVILKVIEIFVEPSPSSADSLLNLFFLLGLLVAVSTGAFGGFLGEKLAKRGEKDQR